jgi:hypothetical protein
MLLIAYTTPRRYLYSKIDCMDTCDNSKIGNFKPLVRILQQHSSSDWHILWTNINQNIYRMQWDRRGGADHNVVPNNDGFHKIKPQAADACMSCTNSDTLVHRMTSCSKEHDTRRLLT